ncbi:uncharacterized protein CDAR_28791 [Caerostris darwini]|uniref:Uncharacterized protein n=1 Tax=Caerostris darwini TaxID=1538125 RepID=A0AAV4Q1E0_9ARAC|nr:uncharacterized protein CDAR_28791 [Caerostris darwini]
MFLCILYSLLIASSHALDLFSIKGRPTGVTSRLKARKGLSRNETKLEMSTSNEIFHKNFSSSTDGLTLAERFNGTSNVNQSSLNRITIRDTPVYGNETILNETNLNSIPNETDSSWNETNLNSMLNETESSWNETVSSLDEAYETVEVLSDILNKRVVLSDTGNNTTDNQSIKADDIGLKSNDTKRHNETIFDGVFQISNFSETVNQTIIKEESRKSHLRPQARSLRNLSPGEEFLLSVANLEDAKSQNWRRLPYLMSFLQKANAMNAGKGAQSTMKRKSGNPGQSEWPLEMSDMINLMNGMDKDDSESEQEKPSSSLLSKLSADPMSLILPALIPVSVLLAAVIPLLSDQFTTGMYMPMVSTTATGDRRGRDLEETNSAEFFTPLLESLVSLGNKTFEDVTEDKYDETKARFLKQAFQMVSSFVNEKWMSLYNRLSKRKNPCGPNNCTTPNPHQ